MLDSSRPWKVETDSATATIRALLGARCHAIEPAFSTSRVGGEFGLKISNSLRAAMAAGSQVIQIIVMVAGGAILGRFLDAKLGYENFLFLIFSGLGFVTSLMLVYRAFTQAQHHDEPPQDAP